MPASIFVELSEFDVTMIVEHFSIDCGKTATKVICLANHKVYIQSKSQSKLEVNTCTVADSKRKKTSVSDSQLVLQFYF